MSKTVLITGSAKGIGKAVALKFFQNGYNVAINYNSSDNEAKALFDFITSNGGNAILVKADITKVDQVNDMVNKVYKRFNSIDVVVNNAGVCYTGLVQDTNESVFDYLFNVNVKGTYLINNAILPKMISNKNGKIINVSSMWGERGASCEVIYSASKAAIIGYTKALAKEVGLSGINVNCVLPGVIDTDMNKHLTKEDFDELILSTPMGRIGQPVDVANLIYYLASDEASFITGQIIGVDGGFIG
ncbi:MAG: 3-oxoacyl-ACP reductase FabG [Clostridia bacterium]|nr:3-oxoacyl-ACP reductase FabG [Clostridia bacterium]